MIILLQIPGNGKEQSLVSNSDLLKAPALPPVLLLEPNFAETHSPSRHLMLWETVVLKYAQKSFDFFSLPNSPPLECRLDLVTFFQQIEYGRKNGAWSSLKQRCGFLLAICLLDHLLQGKPSR